MKELLLVTYEFPFGSGETFLESEIGYLAARFSRISILPSRAVWAERLGSRRSLPANVAVIESRRSALGWLRALWSWNRLLWRSDLRGARDRPLFALYTILREGWKAALLLEAARQFLKGTGAVSTAYSYWKSEAATGLALLKHEGGLRSLVVRCHRGDLYRENVRFRYRPYDRFVFEQASFLVPISSDGKRALEGFGGFPRKILVSRLGVRGARRHAARSDDAVLRIVSCSNLLPVKRVHLLCGALASVRGAFEWVHFGDGPEMERLRRCASERLRPNTYIFMGRVPNSDVLAYYSEHAVDLFVNVSESEGVPVSIMEALAHGIPCVATRVGGTGEILDDKCGCLLESNIDATQLASAIQKVIDDPENWQLKRVAALERWDELCNAEKNLGAFSVWLSEI